MIPFIKALVVFLERVFVEKEEVAGVSQPLFVSDIVQETPDTALEAMAKEADYLAKNVFKVLSRAMGLETRDIVSDKNIEDVVEQTMDNTDVDVDDLYRKRARPIFSAMIEFSSKAMGTTMTPEQGDELYHLQVAARNLVGAVKAMRETHPNMARFTLSENDYIRHAYNESRVHLVKLMRQVETIAEEDIRDIDRIKAMLDELRVEMKTSDLLASGRVDKLIRDGLIDRDMASSLMNDSAYAIELFNNVIEVAEVVFAHIISKEKDLSIMDSDLELTMVANQAQIVQLLEQTAEEIDAIRLKEKPAKE